MSLRTLLPTLAIGSLGGTVCMESEGAGEGVVPRLDCQALLAAIPQLAVFAEVSGATLCLEPSASLGFAQLLKVHRVALFEACLDGDTVLLEHSAGLGCEGLVIAGFGAGHVPACWAPVLEALASELCVVVATRTGSGPTATHGYGFMGGEIDLRNRGVRLAGFLCPRKCRVLLWLLLGCGRLSDVDRFLPSPPG